MSHDCLDPVVVTSYSIREGICERCRHHPAGSLTGPESGALIDARSVSSFWGVSDTSRNKKEFRFTAVPPPSDGEGLWFDMRQPRLSHLNVWIPLDYRRPGARAVVCILVTDSHISIVLIPANIISTEGFISRREEKEKSNPVSPSHKSLVSSRESNCTEAGFFFQQRKVLYSC